MKRKMFTFSAIVAALILLAFYLAPVVTAEDPFASRSHEWTAKQTLRSGMTINSPNSVNKAPIVFGSNSTLTSAAAETHSGTVTFDGPIVKQAYSHKSTVGPLTWSYAYGNILLLSGTTPIAIALPAITAAMDGYVLTVKNVSGATTRTLTPSATLTEYIESTFATLTGTSDATIDAVGDVRTWVAVYSGTISGVSSTWMLVSERLN